MAVREKYRDALHSGGDAAGLSHTSGTHRRSTHEIDAEFGSDRQRPPALPLERRPSLVPTWRAPMPIAERSPPRSKSRESLADWDFLRPASAPPASDDEPTSWLAAHLSALYESRFDGDIAIDDAVLSAAEAAAVHEEEVISGVRPIELGLGDPELDAVREAFERGDHVAVLVEGRALLARRPGSKAVLHYTAAARSFLVRESVEELGGSARIPRSRVSPSALADQVLHPREAFILGLVDGCCTVEEIVDMSGMPQLDALAILLELRRRGVVACGAEPLAAGRSKA